MQSRLWLGHRSAGGGRVRREPPSGQDELLPAWRYHAFIADAGLSTVDADLTHRAHAVVERLFGDLIDGPLARATPDLDAFRRGWIFVGAAALASVLAGCAIAPRRNSADAYRPTLPVVE